MLVGPHPGITMVMNKRQPWNDARRQEVVRLYRSGLTQSEIAAKLGTGQSRVFEALVQMNEPARKGLSGSLNPAWKGGRSIDKNGYVLVQAPGHPYANSGGYVREHRLIMEAKLGRYLLPTEVVHHPGRDHADNDPDKLELFSSNAEHLRHELAGKVPNWSSDGRARMLVAVRKPRKRKRCLAIYSSPDESGDG